MNQKHIGGYQDVQKTKGKLKHRKKTLENKSVVQKIKIQQEL